MGRSGDEAGASPRRGRRWLEIGPSLDSRVRRPRSPLRRVPGRERALHRHVRALRDALRRQDRAGGCRPGDAAGGGAAALQRGARGDLRCDRCPRRRFRPGRPRRRRPGSAGRGGGHSGGRGRRLVRRRALGLDEGPRRNSHEARIRRSPPRGSANRVPSPPYLSGVLLGALQGAFPCALVYGAASRAAVAGSASAGAVVMLVFGLGTVPAIFALSSVPSAVLRRLRGWRWSGFLIVVVGILLILRGLAALGAVPHTAFW